ncbi:MAG: cupin domain-containing protein [Elainellaceae cyanobacterium]
MTHPVINLDDVPLTDWGKGSFAARIGSVGARIGSQKLGYRLVVLPPGKAGWPLHRHHVNEEMFLILEGTGTLRWRDAQGDRHHPVQVGDAICAPPGGSAHQIINTSDVDLRYLAVSTMEAPDVMEYPDSGKFGVFAGSAPGGDKNNRMFSFFGRQSSAVDYWDGEIDSLTR